LIDNTTVQRIIDSAEILEVVGDFVTLKKRGVNYLGNCPFHNEKTPSFTVSPAKGIYKCFGCGKAGNSVGFIMEHEQLTYPDALKYLAKKFHIEIVEKEETPEDVQQKENRESLLIVSTFAQKQFTHNLFNENEGITIGKSYFKERGFSDETIRTFELGYCLNERDAFTKQALKNGYKLQFLTETGLTVANESYQFDRFAGRVMFPIHNIAGRVVAFGGRTLKNDKKIAKYLNSPESEIYHKSNILYGIFQAKREITKQDKCFMVEGYTDVISMHQAGIQNVVASSGTSLTVNQIRLVKRFSPNLTILYDGDAAGIKASLRGIDLVLEEGLNVKVVLLPEGEDPDSFSKQMNVTEFNNFISDNETDFITFKTTLLFDEAKKDPVKRATLITDIVRSISVIPDQIIRSVYIKECSQILDVSEQILYSEISKILGKKFDDNRKREYYDNQQTYQTPSQIAVSQLEIASSSTICIDLEKEIAGLLLSYGNEILFTTSDNAISGLELEAGEHITVAIYITDSILEEIEDLEFTDPLAKRILYLCINLLDEEKEIDIQQLTHHEDAEISKFAADLIAGTYSLSKVWERGDNVRYVDEVTLKTAVPKKILEYKERKIDALLKGIEQDLKIETVPEKQNELMQSFLNLKKLQMHLAKSLGGRTILK